jgi:hypothetical protein
VEGFARQINAEHGLIPVHIEGNLQIWALGLNIGTLPPALTQTIDNGVLDTQRGKTGMIQTRTAQMSIDRKRASNRQMIFPGHLKRLSVELVAIKRFETGHREIDPGCHTGPETKTVGILQSGGEQNPIGSRLEFGPAGLFDFRTQ